MVVDQPVGAIADRSPKRRIGIPDDPADRASYPAAMLRAVSARVDDVVVDARLTPRSTPAFVSARLAMSAIIFPRLS